MSNKTSSPVKSTENRQSSTPGQEVLLRDESDEIIDTLKNQLQSLQRQLDDSRKDSSKDPQEKLRSRWHSELTPHIASRLQMPAEELTERLERLIDQVDEPELKGELEHCRETAFFLFDTFRRIGEKHDDLTESLTAEVRTVKTVEFQRLLDEALKERGLPVSTLLKEPLPEELELSQQSLITVLITLSSLAAAIFGENITLEISDADKGRGSLERIRLVIRSQNSLDSLKKGEALSSLAIRSGLNSTAVVDLLYVEKIIEMRGGLLGFFTQGQRTNGFDVTLPVGTTGK